MRSGGGQWAALGCVAIVACGGSSGGGAPSSDGTAGDQGVGASSAGGDDASSSGGAASGAGDGTSAAGSQGDPPAEGGTNHLDQTSGGAAGSEVGEGGAPDAAGAGGSDSEPLPKPPVERRLPLPCEAALPTGYCFVSEPGDWLGEGNTVSASGEGSVTLFGGDAYGLRLEVTDAATGDDGYAYFEAKQGDVLRPGLFDPATRSPFQQGGEAGLWFAYNGGGCNQITGKFSVEELATDPVQGITRFSATFEQHCEGAVPALRGVINYQATGEVDATPTPDRVIALSGKVFRVAYDSTHDLAYGIDATNRRLSKINLKTLKVTYADVTPVPNDICVDAARGRLFVVNKGSSFVSEYNNDTLAPVRDIEWAGTDWGASDTHFKIYCTTDKVYVVDGAWSPGLFTIDALDSQSPVVTDHTAQVAGVGGLVSNGTDEDLYYWSQVGWSAGLLSTYVRRLQTSDLTKLDESSANLASFNRDPLDAPILLDETRGLVFVKNKVFDAENLTKVMYTLPAAYDTFDGSSENAYALDEAHGRMATKTYLYDLARYDITGWTLRPHADQVFFDRGGNLWSLTTSQGTLEQQLLAP